MQRILIIQENGHHERNRAFRECFSLKRAMDHFSFQADVWGKGHDNFAQPFGQLVRRYDAVISLENYDSGWHPDLSGLSIPKVFWCIDAHMGVDRYVTFARKNRFDIVFNATRKFMDHFKGVAGDTQWLPNAYDSFLIDKLPRVRKTVPLGFCGNVVNRGEWIEYLKRRWNLHHDQMVIGPDMVRAINGYHLHWNLNVSVDINYRTFETLGCGTLLLTNYSPDLPQLFKVDKHLLCYKNKAELDEKIDQVMKHPRVGEKIAEQGYIHVRKHHKYIDRAQTMLRALGFSPQNGKDKAAGQGGICLRGVDEQDRTADFTAQYGEEHILLDFFRNKKKGVVVDVGAADGTRFSNSRYLIKNRGWRGILIEPHPDFIRRLERLYAGDPQVTICPHAVGGKDEIRKLYLYGRDEHAQISTLSKDFKARAIKVHGDKYLPPVDVETKTLKKALDDIDCPKEIDFMSVDCEGLDMEVLQSMDWSRYRVKLICIEQSMPRDVLTRYMDSVGFSYYDSTDGNAFFVLKSAASTDRTDTSHVISDSIAPEAQSGADTMTALSKKMPITIVTETLNYVSGGVRCIVEILNRLKKRGYQTSCHVTHPDLRCEWLDTEFPILPVSEFHKFKGIAISPYSPTAEIVARSNAMGKFYWVHSYEPKFPELTGRSDAWRVMSENSYRFDQVHYFAVSTYVKMILELIYGRAVLSPLVPGGVDTQRFKPGQKGGGALKIMFLGREHGFRGAGDIRRALEQVQKSGVEMEIHVMGQPVDLGGVPHIHHLPLPQDEFAALLAGMDIFIHASHFEGLPLPPLEAMASGCAVIATYIGASDYLLDGHNALVVPPRCPDKIAHAIQRLARDTELRRRLRKGGTETVRRNYTWEHTTDRILEALAEGMDAEPSHKFLPAPSRKKATDQLKETASLTPKSVADGKYLVSAIVSTYNSERFIRGCLEDLEAQTIADKLEIVVVDSGSEQNEGAVVREFQGKYENIKYIRTQARETVYQSWNRAVKAASGKYITNANTDDRHRKDAYEVMTRVLETLPEVALVYADVIITEKENETFDNCTPAGHYRWRNFDRRYLLEGKCFVGPQPMWRRSVHEEYGYFDASFVTSGDFEFWLRISQTHTFLHLPTLLGLYLKSPGSIEHRNRDIQPGENQRLLAIYRKAESEQRIVRRHFGGDAAQTTAHVAASDQADRNVVNSSPDPAVTKIIRKAVTLRQQEAFDRAAALLSMAIVKWPDEKSLYYQLCENFIDAEQYDEALKILEKRQIPEADLKRVELMAAIFSSMGRDADAERVLDRALTGGLVSPSLFSLKGVAAYKRGETEKAESLYEKAYRLDRNHGPAFTNMGLLRIEAGKTAEGLKFLERGFETTPIDAHVLATYHETVTEHGEYERAEPRFRKALGRYPFHKKLNYLFIDLLVQQEKHEAAMSAVENAIAVFGVADGILNPALSIREKVGVRRIADGKEQDHTVSLCMIVKNEEKNLARCLLSASKIVDEIIIADTGSDDKTREIAAAFGATVYDFSWKGDFADARNFTLDQAKGGWILILDADELLSRQDHERFENIFEAQLPAPCAYAFVTRNYVNDVGLEGWQANDGQYREAAGAGWCPSTKVRLFPNDARIRFENALHEKVESSLKRAGIAVKSCDIPIHHYGKLTDTDEGQKKKEYYRLGQKKVAEDEGNLDALVENAIQAGEVGEFAVAAGLWEKVLKHHPQYAKAHFNLGYVKIHLRDYNRARLASETALRLDPTLKEAALNLSICELRCGEVGKSIRLLEEFLARNPEHPMAMGNLGVGYCIGGEPEKGFELFDQVRKMGFDCDDFISHHVTELNAAGKPEMATSLEHAVARHNTAE